MKIVYSDWNQIIELSENKVNVVCLENRPYFTKIISELNKQIEGEEGKFILSDFTKAYSLKKQAAIVFSPFSLNFQNKKFQGEMLHQLIEVAQEEEFSLSHKVESLMLDFIYKLTDYLDYEVYVPSEISVENILKSAGLKIDEGNGNLLERVLDYFILLHKVIGIQVIFTVNLRTYFSMEQLNLLYRNVTQHKIHLVLMENHIDELLPCEDAIIIDKDLCEI